MDKNLDQQQGTHPSASDNTLPKIHNRRGLDEDSRNQIDQKTPTVLHGQSKSDLSVSKKDGKKSRSIAQTPISMNDAATRTGMSGVQTHAA